MKTLINSKDDIVSTLDKLNMSKSETCLVSNICRNIYGGIYYSDKFNCWCFYVDCFNIIKLNNDDDLGHLYRSMFSFYKDSEIIFTKFNDKESLFYNIKQSIIKSIIDGLTGEFVAIKSIISDVKNDMFKPISFPNSYGILVGCSATIEDYYYLYMTTNMEIYKSSCVGGYDIISENKIPNDLKELMSNTELEEIIISEKTKIKDSIEIIIV